MAAPTALYLFKTARRPVYLKENLQILAAERGSIVEAAYNRMWVAPQYYEAGTIAKGFPVYFVFTERPYSHFVPVRQGEVIDVERTDLTLRIRVLLRSWVGLDDVRPEEFSYLVNDMIAGSAPGTKFVAPKLDDVEIQSYYDEREDEGWCRVVDEVLRMSRECADDPYRKSIFFRPRGLRIGGELHVARTVPLEPGARASLSLRFYNPHLSEDEISGHSLRLLAPEDALRAEPPGSFPLSGELVIPFEMLGGEPELTVQVVPSPALHTSVTERLVAYGRTMTRAEGAEATVSPPTAELLALYHSVLRKAVFSRPADELDVLAGFQRILPDEPRIVERTGILLTERGEEAEAIRVLRRINPELLGDDARFTLFRLLLRRDTAASPDQHLVSLDLAAESRFPRLLDELERLDSGVLARLVPALVLDLPADQRRDVMSRLGSQLTSPSAIVETARNLWLSENASWAFEYLSERRRTLRLDAVAVVETLLELAAESGDAGADPGLTDDIALRIRNLIERGEPDEALALLERIRSGLSRYQRDRLYHRIADQLAGRREYAAAARVMIQLAYAASETGDLQPALEAVESATEAVARARGLLGRTDDAPLAAMLEDVRGRVEAAWKECEELVAWSRSAEEYRRVKIQEVLRNRRILVAGGLRNPEWIEYLQELTGAKVDWCNSFRDEVDNVDAFAERIRQGTYAVVVHYVQKTGHDLGGKLKPACEAAAVPFAATPSAGRRGVEAAVWGAVDGK
jgi:hypothetical protein